MHPRRRPRDVGLRVAAFRLTGRGPWVSLYVYCCYDNLHVAEDCVVIAPSSGYCFQMGRGAIVDLNRTYACRNIFGGGQALHIDYVSAYCDVTIFHGQPGHPLGVRHAGSVMCQSPATCEGCCGFTCSDWLPFSDERYWLKITSIFASTSAMLQNVKQSANLKCNLYVDSYYAALQAEKIWNVHSCWQEAIVERWSIVKIDALEVVFIFEVSDYSTSAMVQEVCANINRETREIRCLILSSRSSTKKTHLAFSLASRPLRWCLKRCSNWQADPLHLQLYRYIATLDNTHVRCNVDPDIDTGVWYHLDQLDDARALKVPCLSLLRFKTIWGK